MSKPVLSSRLMGLKFMQRAAEKEKKAEATEAAEERDAEAHWVVEGARTRCVVLAEGDPPPSEAAGGGAAGRLSFGGFNAGTEQLVAEATATQEAAAAEAVHPGGKAVSDEAMAATLRRQGRQPTDGQRGQKHGQQQHRQQDGQRQSKGGGKHKREGDERGSGGQRGKGGGGKRARARYFG